MPFPRQLLLQLLAKWFDSLKDIPAAQEQVLQELISEYSKTKYGAEKDASKVASVKEFQTAFPIMKYVDYESMVQRALDGDHSILCASDPLAFVMTRGTSGHPKVIPCTQKHLDKIFECGAREILNQALRTEDLDLLDGYILNLNFPSVVKQAQTKDGIVNYGYSSGTYAKLKPTLGSGGLIPLQEDIDSLGPGIMKADWNRRFELAYQKTKDLPIIAVMGVTPVLLSFGYYVKRTYGHYPKDLWKMKALFCTSVAKIHFKYGPECQRLFGKAPVREIYSATEGVFGQQLDDYPYLVPNFDSYFFEVKMGDRIKMLHEMKKGEWGRLIISTQTFPRYDIGDMIESMGGYYYRVFGRAKPLVELEHRLYRSFLSWAV